MSGILREDLLKVNELKENDHIGYRDLLKTPISMLNTPILAYFPY
ncbi:hypothetical protein [Priestia endophytica]|nr:hypothetical protein [Priestia endophytica]